MRYNVRVTLSAVCIVSALALVAGAAGAHGPKPAGVVKALHEGMVAGDRDAVLALFLADAEIYGSGRSLTLDEYAETLLESNMSFAASTKREVLATSEREVGEAAWVTTRSLSTGTVEGSNVDVVVVETVVLQHVKEGWRIAHVHWSSTIGR